MMQFDKFLSHIFFINVASIRECNFAMRKLDRLINKHSPTTIVYLIVQSILNREHNILFHFYLFSSNIFGLLFDIKCIVWTIDLNANISWLKVIKYYCQYILSRFDLPMILSKRLRNLTMGKFFYKPNLWICIGMQMIVLLSARPKATFTNLCDFLALFDYLPRQNIKIST